MLAPGISLLETFWWSYPSFCPPDGTLSSKCAHGSLRLEMEDCTVAPAAIEDSDHEIHSSSDERDSVSPHNPHRDDNDEEVSVPHLNVPIQNHSKWQITLLLII